MTMLRFEKPLAPYTHHNGISSWTISLHMVESLRGYAEHGIRPGSFTCAILANNLVDACANADHHNIEILPAYAAYLYNEMPNTAWGSYAKIDAWVEKFRLARENERAQKIIEAGGSA